MINESTSFDFSLEPDNSGFNPLEDDHSENSEGSSSVGENIAAASDSRSAEERTADLISSMSARRSVLLGILSFCAEPQSVEKVNALADQLQENNYSVYTPADLCSLLEKAGALDRVTADGLSVDSIDIEPRVVVVDGVEYLEAGEPVEFFWVATEAGKQAVVNDKPFDRLRDLFDENFVYLPIYQRILTMCEAEGGASAKSIGEAVDSDPLVQKPRFYATYFVDQLEASDALTWDHTWSITEVGKTGLDILNDTLGND